MRDPTEAEVELTAEATPPEPTEAEDVELIAETTLPEPPATAEPVEERDRTRYLKRWTFVVVLVAVWIPAFVIGLGVYYWWYHDHSLHKTSPVFVVLMFVVSCTVAAIVIAMSSKKPLIAAISIAIMTAPYAAIIAAAPLYGNNYCEIRQKLDPTSQCLLGILPY